MDLFVLDSQLRRSAVFDLYESLIWTERYSSVGEFELVIPSSLKARSLLVPNTWLAINESTRVMTIETITDRANSEGRVFMEIRGPSLEDILNDRVAKNPVPNTDIRDLKWYFDDKVPAEVAREVFKLICVDGALNLGDKIPFYTPGNIYPADTIPEPSDIVPMAISPTSVYQAIQEICNIYDLGFRLVRNGDTGQLMFNIYSGNDLTTLQTVKPPVIFAPELDNLTDVAYLTAVGAYKNVAHVISPDGEAFVYADNVDPSVAGFERKVLHVDAGDISYYDRTAFDPLPYTVTEEQDAAVQIASNLDDISQFQKDSLSKLPNMKRLYAQDLVNINAVIGTPFALVGTESASLLSAQSVVGWTQAQKDALIQLRALGRLTSSHITTLDQFVANNTALNSTQKADIIAAAVRQYSTVVPAEKTLIEAAITASQGFEPTEDALLQLLLVQRGKDQLAQNTNLAAFDGEIPRHSQYVYNRDYQLGDLVEIRNADQVTNQMRVTEQIFASDSSGERAYPTLAQKLLITAGSWYAEPSAVVWDDLTNPADTWASRP